MHLPDEQSNKLAELAEKLRAQVRELLKDLQPCGEPVNLSGDQDIFANIPNSTVFLVQSGQLSYSHTGKTAYILEPGDLVGLSRTLGLPIGTVKTSEPTQLLPYDRTKLITHVNSDEQKQKLWAYYLISRSTFFREGLAQEIRSHFQPSAGFLHFSAGDTIITQGTEADCVYTLLEGKAEALHNQVKVGEINTDEMFGAMAVFTRQKRSASVIATTDCTVMAVRKEDFIDLVDHQPRVGLSLIEEMAATINQLNNQVHELKNTEESC